MPAGPPPSSSAERLGKSCVKQKAGRRHAVQPPHASCSAALANEEVGTAAAVDPDTALVISPAITLGAAGVAPLFHELHAASRVCRTVIPLHIVRGAGDRLATARTARPITRPPWPVGVDPEICATATIDPDTVPVVAPGRALNAGGTADLPPHRNAALCICRAVIPLSVIRRASDHLLCRCRPTRYRDQCADAQSHNEKSSHSHFAIPPPTGILHRRSSP